MQKLIVVDNPAEWPLHIAGIDVVAARSYLTDDLLAHMREARVFNLCRSYRYQGSGYYVSLLAAARGHKPIPNIATIQDIKSQSMVRLASDELEDLIQTCLQPIRSEQFTLSIYFGRNLARRYDTLSLHLFNLFPVPFLRSHFSKTNDKWSLQSLKPIAASEIPDEHNEFVRQVTLEYFAGRGARIKRKRVVPRYSVAILYNEADATRPCDPAAIEKFVRAGESLGLGVEIIIREDFGRLSEFDALFIRETTAVDHHTYRFAQKAQAEGLVVIDDPESILKCTNKVYLAELMQHYRIPAPKTLIVHRDNAALVTQELKTPCILKEPDSSSSLGVVKVDSQEQCVAELERMLSQSELVIAQEFVPTDFDWRIGVINREPLFACKYFMAKNHWQVINWQADSDHHFGKSNTLPVEMVPQTVIKTALRAANLIGDSFYGVDIKQVGRKCYVIEVNDNPNTDTGVEDVILKDQLYLRIMKVFLARIEQQKARVIVV